MSLSLFTIPANDQSIFYLGQIFGNIGGVLPVTNAPLLLSVMFKVLNTAALSVGAMIVVYTTVAGLLSTASEGEFLGKKWSGLWVPVRTVLGIVGLFPSSGGYCAIQVIIMWLILQGIGLGDTLWTAVLNFMNQNGGSPYASVNFPDVGSHIKPKFENLFKGLVCYESLAATYQKGGDPEKYSYLCTSNPSDPRCGASLPEFNAENPRHSYDLGVCGTLQFCNPSVPNPQNIPECNSDVSSRECKKQLQDTKKWGACYDQNSLDCLLCKAQIQALPGIISVFDSIAKKFVDLDYDYQKFYYTSTSQTLNKTPQWIQDFCNAKPGLQNKCCVNNIPGMPAEPPDPLCSRSIFNPQYDPKSLEGSVNPHVVEEVYAPYGILPYLGDVDFMTAATNQYIGLLTGAYTSYIAALPPAQLSGWQAEARNNGWILAGMYYFSMSKANASRQINLGNLPSLEMSVMIDPMGAPDGSSLATIKGYRNNIAGMNSLLEAINDAAEKNGDLSSSATPVFKGISNSISHSSINMLKDFMSYVAGGNGDFSTGVAGKLAVNPLAKISASGYHLMFQTQIAFGATMFAVGVAAGLTALNFTVLGTGMTLPPQYEIFKALWNIISPLWILMISALFSLGAILGIYLPLIPYTIYIMGAVGWLMATLEAMVAGPIIALGIMSPSGQHELLGKSEPAVLIIFSLILRPSLMVFGMMASMFLASVVVTMINVGFAKVADDMFSGHSSGLVEGIVFMIAYTSLLVMALNKVFSLIHVIPEKALTYIGGQAMSYGEGEGLAGMKQAMEGGTGAIAGGGKESGQAPAAAATKMGQDRAHAREESRRHQESRGGTDLTAQSKGPGGGQPGGGAPGGGGGGGGPSP
ncbi:MAG: hypothetical protein K0S27_752 [Gammaproteobacteria bacterium]|jgi:hypothetical protein|nr:hypothetical protein [Gammaproteobacteria bacterium]